MKKMFLFFVLALLVPASSAWAQRSPGTVQFEVATGQWHFMSQDGRTDTAAGVLPFVGVPTGTCTSMQLAINTSNGTLYTCNAGVWLVGGGGSGSGVAFAIGGGTAQAQTVAPTTAITNATLTAYATAAVNICWVPIAANTGAAPTLAGSGTSTFSAKPITKYGTVALVANDITTLGVACVIYDGTEFQLQVPLTNVTNPAAQYGVPYYSAAGTNPTLSGAIPGLTGQSLSATNASAPTFVSPGVPGRTTAAATDTVLCDSGTAIRDRASTVEYTAAAVTVTLPDAGSSGCAANFVTELIAGSGTTATVNRQTASTFTIYNGSTVTSAATTFNLTAGQYAAITSRDNTNWIVRIVSGGGGSGFPPCVTTTGAVNVMVATYSPAITPTTGTLICFLPNLANTINNPTINVNGFGAKTVTRFGGGALLTSPSSLLTTAYAYAVYDGSTNFQLLNDQGDAYVSSSLTANGSTCIPSSTSSVSIGGSSNCLNGNSQWAFQGFGILENTGSLASGTAVVCAVTVGDGAFCGKEGAGSTAVAGVDDLDADSTLHDWTTRVNGGGKRLNVNVAPTPIHVTAQTAAISTATLCAASAGACNQAGNYTVEWAFTQTGTACATPNFAGVTFLLTWTDFNGTAHSAISLAMDDSSSLVATSGLFTFRTTNAAAWASGQFNLSSNGSIIQYATGYTACSVGTGTYELDAWVTRKE